MERDPLGNGQPELSLSSHQPASIPRRPRRGLTSQTPQTPSPRSLTGRRANLWRPGSSLISRSRSRARASCSARERARRLASATRSASASRERSSCVEPSSEGPTAAPASQSGGLRCGKAPATIAESSRSRRAICSLSAARAARSSSADGSSPMGRPGSGPRVSTAARIDSAAVSRSITCCSP